jgi:hypothetical protein
VLAEHVEVARVRDDAGLPRGGIQQSDRALQALAGYG